eukprot:ANDGO_04960.mRNA.1 GPI-anchor transamidase
MKGVGVMHVGALLLALFVACCTCSDVPTYALIISTSKYWNNYRHSANALRFYKLLRERGIPDSKIVLMLSDCPACNSRNPFPGRVYPSEPLVSNSKASREAAADVPPSGAQSFYTKNTEIDYQGFEVTRSSILTHLFGTYGASVPPSKTLDFHLKNDSSSAFNLVIFMTGHSGVGFAKLQDHEEVVDADWAAGIHSVLSRFRNSYVLFIADTCRAASLFTSIELENELFRGRVGGVGSSDLVGNSYGFLSSSTIGQSTIDGFSANLRLDWSWAQNVNHMNRVGIGSAVTSVGTVKEWSQLLPLHPPGEKPSVVLESERAAALLRWISSLT